MKLVRITHYRCREDVGYTYVMAPDDWDEDTIEAKVKLATRNNLSVVEADNSETPPNDYRPGPPPYSKYPNWKVSDIDVMWEEKKKAWSEWKVAQRKLQKSFRSYLEDEGFTPISEDTTAIDVTADWGHAHGLSPKMSLYTEE